MILIIHDPIYVQDVLVAIDEPNTAAILRSVRKAGYRVSDLEEFGELLEMGVSGGRTVSDLDSGAVVIRLHQLRRGNAGDISRLVHECTELQRRRCGCAYHRWLAQEGKY